MSDIQYLLDEHVGRLFHRELRKRAPELVVWRMGSSGAPPVGTLDPDILLWCARNDCILVTNNHASMPIHLTDHLAEGRHVPGIFTLNSTMTFNETIEELILIWMTSEMEEYTDQIRYLPISRA